MDAAVVHCTEGIGIWQWASNDQDGRTGRGDGLLRRHTNPGDTGRCFHPSQEILPDLKIRVINVVDLMKLQPSTEHPHGPDREGLRLALHRKTSTSYLAFTGTPG